MIKLLCLLFHWHRWRYLGDFTSRQCRICKHRQRAWLIDEGYVWLPEGTIPGVSSLNSAA
jgi:hypothetical protein